MSQVMKVFIVTQAGKVADVTLQSSCQAEDESVIKVSAVSSHCMCMIRLCATILRESE